MAVKESLKVNYFQIKSNITDQTIDLRAGTPVIEYRESIFSPYVEVTGYLADTGNTVPDKDDSGEAVGLLDGEFGEGTEEILFEIEDAQGKKVRSSKSFIRDGSTRSKGLRDWVKQDWRQVGNPSKKCGEK